MSISHLSKLCMFPFYRFYFKDTIKEENVFNKKENMKIDISNLFYTTLPRSVCLSPLHSPPSHSCTRAPCTSVSQWPAATGSQAHCHFQWPVRTGSQAHWQNFYWLKVFIGPKLREVSKSNFHRKAPKLVKNEVKRFKNDQISTKYFFGKISFRLYIIIN